MPEGGGHGGGGENHSSQALWQQCQVRGTGRRARGSWREEMGRRGQLAGGPHGSPAQAGRGGMGGCPIQATARLALGNSNTSL